MAVSPARRNWALSHFEADEVVMLREQKAMIMEDRLKLGRKSISLVCTHT